VSRKQRAGRESFASLALLCGLALGGCSLLVTAAESDTDSESAQADGGPTSGADGGSAGADAAPPAERAAVYAHSADTLYKLDPNTLEVSTVGDFSGCGSMIDIALDKDSNLFGTTFSGLYRIDIETAACTEIASGSYPNSLSFVPADVLEPGEEVLVAYEGSQYVRIDVASGAKSNIGSISGYTSSGDVVSVEGGGTYLTADGSGCDDCLLQINPADGSLIKNWGTVGMQGVYGLAYWGGVAYGFDDSGVAFAIEFGSDTVTTNLISFPDSPAGLSFWGAGSTTQAPIVID
jgi:hypothetical protein